MTLSVAAPLLCVLALVLALVEIEIEGPVRLGREAADAVPRERAARAAVRPASSAASR